MRDEVQKGDALLIIDVQNDFCPSGALPIEHGDEVVPALNRWIQKAISAGVPVLASRDWHPKGHVSFSENGGDWPPHCVQDTEGAAFHPGLKLPESVVKVTKGVRFDHDQNSAFDETGLATELKRQKVQTIYVGGLAQDVCVLATVLDGRKEGFEVVLIQKATRPVTQEGGEKALEDMRAVGASIMS